MDDRSRVGTSSLELFHACSDSPTIPDRTRTYGRLRRDLAPHQFVRVPAHLAVGDPDHRWGRSPVHYVEEYYRTFLDLLDHATASPRR